MKTFAIFASLSGLLSLGTAAPQFTCYGCIESSTCKSSDGSLRFSYHTYYLLDNWMNDFGSKGSIPSNSAYATCDTDWCIIMQNTAGATNDYSQDEAQGAINDLKNGEADGCGNYAKKVGSNDYLQIDVTSSVYRCGDGGETPVTQLYGSYYDGSIPDGC